MQSRAVEQAAAKANLLVPQEAQRRDLIPLLNGGFRTDRAPADLAPNETADMQGLHIVAGRLVVDTGYVPFGSIYRGVAQGTFQVFFNDGSTVLLLFTTETVYRWNSSVLQWQLVSINAIHTTTAGYGAGVNAFALNSVTDIVNGTLVGITLDDGSQLITTVTNVAVLTITTLDAVPVGRTVANGAEVYVQTVLTGDPTISQISAEVFPGNDWIIFSNGINPVSYYFQGVVKNLPGLPAATTCGTIAVFHELVLLGNMTENGTHLPHRVRQSDAGNPAEWTLGIAAIYDLLDTDDFIFKLLSFGPWMILYRESSIMRGSYLGVLNEIIFWEYMVQLDGAQSQGAVCDAGGEHVFVGVNGVYSYKGGYDLEQIGEQVFTNFLSPTGDFNAAAKLTLFTIHVPDLDEVWIVYPSVGFTTPNKMLRVQLENQAWSVRMFAKAFYAARLTLPEAFTSWAAAKGTWQNTQWLRPWSSRTFVQNVPSVLLCPTDIDGLLNIYDYAAMTDYGVTIPWTLTTREFGDGDNFTRWESLSFVAIGDGVLVERSQDEGATFQTVDTLDFGIVAASKQTYVDRVSTRLQLRLSGTDPSFQLRRGTLMSEEESEW